jgi:hypothetical protein
MNSKICPDCGMERDLDEFPFRPKPRDKRGTYCKSCMNVRSAASRNKRAAQEGRTIRPQLKVPGMKRCPRCELVLPHEAFGKNRASRDGMSSYCRPCHNVKSREAAIRLYGSTRSYHLKARYGITAEQFDVILAEQGGLCAICREKPAVHVDHDHVTGAIRGLTCFNCNGGLGQFRDRVDIMRQAIHYLERTGTPQCQRVLVEPGVYRVISRPLAAAASPSSSLPLRPSSSPPV